MRFNVPELASHIRKLKEARENRKTAIMDFKFRLYDIFDAHRDEWLGYVTVIAHLDCLNSLAKASTALGAPSCRPKLIPGDSGIVEFRELRHPSLAVRRDFIPNDVALGGHSDRIILLTGMFSYSISEVYLTRNRIGPNMG